MEHLSLVELNKLIQKTLKDNLEPSYWVVAEIGELRVNQNGHCYLELIENQQNAVVAKAKATIWSYTYRNLSTWFQGITGQPLAEGMKILANVKISFHELYGFSLNVQDIDASYTIGEKEKLKQQVINQLIKDGIFDLNKELELPIVPQRIAVISSSTAAGYGDFMQQLAENSYGYHIEVKLFNAIMQGAEAPNSIITALHKVNAQADFDLVVLIRGGGSQLDLECFDNYDLCSNIAQFPFPLITGIGHDRDETIADLVAHTKLKTPTAVAEFIIRGMAAFETEINEEAEKIGKNGQFMLQNALLKVQNIEAAIRMNAKSTVLRMRHEHENTENHLRQQVNRQLNNQKNNLAILENLHHNLRPEVIFKRGYSLATIDGKTIANTNVKAGKKLLTYTLKQIIESTITEVKKNDKI